VANENAEIHLLFFTQKSLKRQNIRVPVTGIDSREWLINHEGGYLPQDMPSFASLAAEADKRFFLEIEAMPDHALKHLLPPKKIAQVYVW